MYLKRKASCAIPLAFAAASVRKGNVRNRARVGIVGSMCLSPKDEERLDGLGSQQIVPRLGSI